MIARLLSAVTCIVAVVMFVSAPALFPYAGVTEYSQTVTEVGPGSIPDNATVSTYADLSSPGQRVIDQGPGQVTIRGDRPTEFEYTDYRKVDAGVHYVRTNTTYYKVETAPGGFDTSSIWEQLLQGTAIFLGIVGGTLAYYRQAMVSLGLGFGCLMLLGIGTYVPHLLVPRGRLPWGRVVGGTWILIVLALSYVTWQQSTERSQ